MPDDNTKMSIGEHVEQLRWHLLRALLGVSAGVVVCFIFRRILFGIFTWPLSVATGGTPPPLYYLAPPEAFTAMIRLCLVAGVILASPYMLWEAWRFVAVGLYRRERRTVLRYIGPSIGLFIGGAAFFFVIVAPLVLRFFLLFADGNFPAPPSWWAGWLGERAVTTVPIGAESDGFVKPCLRLSEYLHFVSVLSLAFGLAFQTPLVVLFTVRSGIVTIETMRRFRRHVFLIIMLISAFITPPDWLSMIALSVPMYLLYEVGLLVARKR
ncbi:MAG: twin-arginine translocase subunit TatC [Phycisphaerae bacterium]|nr:twin-arginine translocase subunit TatC [Phycisphaerae bacterium]